jgi:hypothetical protein
MVRMRVSDVDVVEFALMRANPCREGGRLRGGDEAVDQQAAAFITPDQG